MGAWRSSSRNHHPLVTREHCRSMNQSRSGPRLGEILVASRVISTEQLQAALEEQMRVKRPLGAILIDRDMAEPYEVAQAVARQVGLLAVDLQRFSVDPDALSLVSAELCEEHEMLPIQVHGDLVLVAMAHPRDDEAYAAIREALAPKRVRCVVANESQIQATLRAARAELPQAAVA